MGTTFLFGDLQTDSRAFTSTFYLQKVKHRTGNSKIRLFKYGIQILLFLLTFENYFHSDQQITNAVLQCRYRFTLLEIALVHWATKQEFSIMQEV
jgi:hypothetical protein